MSTMTDVQLMFVRHWIKKRQDDSMKKLGGLLGVYWTSENYKPSLQSTYQAEKKKVKEIWTPLAAILNPDVLNKVLEGSLDFSDSNSSMITNDGEFDMSKVPANDYLKMWNQQQKKDSEQRSEQVSEPQAEPAKQFNRLPSDDIVMAAPGTKIDLEAIAALDPELARHLDPNVQW